MQSVKMLKHPGLIPLKRRAGLFAIPKMQEHPGLATLKRRAGLFAIPRMQEHPELASLKRRAGLYHISMSQTHRDVVYDTVLAHSGLGLLLAVWATSIVAKYPPHRRADGNSCCYG